MTMNIHIYIIHHTHKHRDACILDKVDSIHRQEKLDGTVQTS